MRKCACRTTVVCALGMLLAPALLGSSPHASAPPRTLLIVHEPRLVILKSLHACFLYDGDVLARVFPVDIAAGDIAGGGRGDERGTPQGRFQVVTRNARSPHHRFLGISYPGVQEAEEGQRRGWLSAGEAECIRQAQRTGGCPPWNTALGGGFGLHGGRRGTDWTRGCVAFSDSDIEELFRILRLGDFVEILP